jgi:3-oxoacyl-[acyl-carrier protein] reductase
MVARLGRFTGVDLGLTGKVALVTGASAGLGRAVAAELAGEGAQVAITSRSRERIDAAAAAIGARGFVHDTGDADAAGALIEEVERELGPIAVLVTNSGGPPGGPDPLAFTREQWEDAYGALVLGPLALVERAIPGMRERGFGRILAVGSSSVREPIPGLMLSNAHRVGLLAALETIAREVAADGVTINMLLPGRFLTDRAIGLAGSREEVEARAALEVPVGRAGTVEEFAAAAAFLCSARASYITGTTLLVDGGLTRAL